MKILFSFLWCCDKNFYALGTRSKCDVAIAKPQETLAHFQKTGVQATVKVELKWSIFFRFLKISPVHYPHCWTKGNSQLNFVPF